MCAYVIYLTILPPPHWPFPIPCICTVQAIKTRVSDWGHHPGPLLAAGPWRQPPPAPTARSGGPIKPRGGSRWREHLGRGCRRAQAERERAAGGGNCREVWEGSLGLGWLCGGQRPSQAFKLLRQNEVGWRAWCGRVGGSEQGRCEVSLKAGSELREHIHFPWPLGPRAASLIQVVTVSWEHLRVGHSPHNSESPVTAVPFSVAFPCSNHFPRMLGPGLPCWAQVNSMSSFARSD